MGRYVSIILLLLVSSDLHSQRLVKIKVVDSLTQQGIPQVCISENNNVVAITDNEGSGMVNLKAGAQLLSFSSVGYTKRSVLIDPADSTLVIVVLIPEQKTLDDVILVSSTRNNQRIENSPLKVEVLGREEMDEENTIKPANIASILGDISGIQIQQSSAVSGNASVRIQGLEGRYTQVLRDGMPLFDCCSG